METEHRGEEPRVSGPAITGIAAAFDGREAPPLRPGEILGTTTATRLSPEVAVSDDGSVDNRTNKRSWPLVFDVFAADDEDDDGGLPSERQRPPKRFLRDSPSFTGIGEVQTPLVKSLQCVAGLHTDANHEEDPSNGHREWQAHQIVAERLTASGLEYEVSVQKTCWLPKAMPDIKLVKRYRLEQRIVTRVRTR